MGDRVVYMNGGTGFIGRALCAALLSQSPGEGASKLYVQTRMPGHHRHRNIQFVSSYSDLPEDVIPSVIINLAGAPIADNRWSESQKKLLIDSRVKVTERLFRAIEEKGHQPEVLLNASAIGLYGISGNSSLNEESPVGRGFAAELCQKWEQSAQLFQALGARVCRMRIGVVLGVGGGALARLLPLYKLGLGGPIGAGEQWLSWVHLNDLVRLFVEAMNDSRYEGAVNCTAPNPVRQAEFARALGQVLGRPSCLRTPASVLRLIYGQMAEELLIGGQRVLPAVAQKYGFNFEYAQLSGALQDIVSQSQY